MGTAKAKEAVAEKPPAPDKQAVTTVPQGAVAINDYGAFAGAGFEGAAPSDFKPSFLRVLQPLSPQVTGEMPGAKPGIIWDSITNAGFSNVLFVPVVREHLYVAWKPRNEGGGEGAGFGGVFQLDSKTVMEALARHGKEHESKFERNSEGKIIQPRTEDGEFELVETVYFHGNQIIEDSGAMFPVTVPFSSTGLPVAANWFTTMRREIIPGSSKPFPLFAHVFRIASSKVTKAGKTWYVPTVTWAFGSAKDSRLAPDDERFAAAVEVHKAFAEGRSKVDYAAAGQGDGPGKGGKAETEVPF